MMKKLFFFEKFLRAGIDAKHRGEAIGALLGSREGLWGSYAAAAAAAAATDFPKRVTLTL